MKSKAIFLDRDGTINKIIGDKAYVSDFKKVELLPNVKEALLKLKKLWYKLIVITNQTWVWAWFYTKQEAEAINNKIEELLWFKFDGIYSCYHHPDDNCSCRKPNIANIEKAIKDFNIDVKQSYFVWDKEKDVLAWKNAWCKANFLVTYWKNINFETAADYVVNDLLEMIEKI